ncbi:unnamed protein product [Pleuronectes platessa]|uniref:Phosphoinositide phospholipase C n=1 Tax=Pleuronectes platessa TaxID=8262 RepID=A0A9N7UTJ1_PLEPL|nr:unnamed protein product [Pleuronectes platessa]
MRSSWLGELFDEADCNNSKQITICIAVQLVKKLNPGLKNIKIELKFKELQKAKDKPGSDVTKDEFIEVFHDLCTRPEIYFLFVQFSSNKEFLDTKDLMIFLEAEQGMAQVSEDISLEVIQKYEPSKEGQLKGWLSLDGFTNYVMSPECHIFDPEHKTVCQDMNQPLSHYYINASHNTYLIEDQFRGPSDVTGYIRALKMGCRSVELDVWDGPDNEPVIYTGHTMTSQIVFRSVIDVINKYSFVASEFPLMLCLENHCSLKQQRVMFQHLKKILGDKIILDPPKPEDCYLPSPSELKGKILLKGKKLSTSCTASEGEVTDEDEGAEMSQRMSIESSEQQTIALKKFQLSKDLSDLVTLCKSVEFKDFATSFQSQKHWELCSFNEVFATRHASDFPGDFVNYNKKFLARVYPEPHADRLQQHEPTRLLELLHMKIISGQNFPKPKGSGAKGDVVDPYVYVEIHGIPADCAEQRTKTVNQNGDNPLFDESFEFQINLPELAMVRFVVLDDDFIGDEFIGQYTIPFECLQPGFRHIPLQSLTGEVLPHTLLFVHVAITNRRGGAILPLREATDLRENMQNAIVSFKELCGLSAVANLKQCILALSPRLAGPDVTPILLFNLADQYPELEPQGLLPEVLKKVVTTYEMVIQTSRAVLETYEGIYDRILQTQKAGPRLPLIGQRSHSGVIGQPLPSRVEVLVSTHRCVVWFNDDKRVRPGSKFSRLFEVVFQPETQSCRGRKRERREERRREEVGKPPRETDPSSVRCLMLIHTDALHHSSSCDPLSHCRCALRREESSSTASESVPVSRTCHLAATLLFSQADRWNFTRTSRTWPRRRALKGRKLHKAVESFTWNITILKGQADLLKHAKSEVQENLKQIHYAVLTCNLSKGGAAGGSSGSESRGRRSLDAIAEKAPGEEELTVPFILKPSVRSHDPASPLKSSAVPVNVFRTVVERMSKDASQLCHRPHLFICRGWKRCTILTFPLRSSLLFLPVSLIVGHSVRWFTSLLIKALSFPSTDSKQKKTTRV